MIVHLVKLKLKNNSMATSDQINKAHKRGIGGSEVSAILGLDKYSSPYKVWLIKTGREKSFVGNKYTVAGNLLEAAVVEYFAQETKYRVIKSSADQKLVVHPKYEFAIGYRDRLYVKTSTIGKGVLECKTTQQIIDDVPVTWFSQLQWYLGVSNLSYGAVAWLEHGLDFKYKEYDYDSDYFDFMIGRVRDFWNNHILTDIPPEPTTIDDIQRMFTRHIEGSKMDATPEMLGVYNELKSLRGKLKIDEARETELIEKVKFAMRDNEVVIDGNKPIFTWRTTEDSTTFDSKKLKDEFPDIYERYCSKKPGVRRFLIK